MSNDYHDAVDDARLDAAARNVLSLSTTDCPVPVQELAARVVTETFCTCVTDAADACESRVSTIHTGLIEEVVRRAEAATGSTRTACQTS